MKPKLTILSLLVLAWSSAFGQSADCTGMCARIYQQTIEQHQREEQQRQRDAAAPARSSGTAGSGGSNRSILELRAAEERQRAAAAQAELRALEQRLSIERAAAGTCSEVSNDVMHVAGVLLVPGWDTRVDRPDYWSLRVQALAKRHSLACTGADAPKVAAPANGAIVALQRCALAGAACDAAAVEAAALALGRALGEPLDPCLLDGKGAIAQARSWSELWNEEKHSAAGQRLLGIGRYADGCRLEGDVAACRFWAANARTASDAVSALSLACKGLSASGCFELGQLLRDGATGLAPSRTAAAPQFLQACRLGVTGAALKTSLNTRGAPATFPRGTGTGMAADVVVGALRQELKQTCDADGNSGACTRLWRDYVLGRDGPVDYAAAADVLEGICRNRDPRGCGDGGTFVFWGDRWNSTARKPDPQRAARLFRQGCWMIDDYAKYDARGVRNLAVKQSCEGIALVYAKPQESDAYRIALSDAENLEQIGWDLMLPCRLLGDATLCDYARAISACTFDAAQCLWGQVPDERRQALMSTFRQARAARLVVLCTYDNSLGIDGDLCKDAMKPVVQSHQLTGLPPADQEALIRVAYQYCDGIKVLDACRALPNMLGDWQRSAAPKSRAVLDIARRVRADDFFEIEATACRKYSSDSPVCRDVATVRKLADLAEAEFRKSPIMRDGPGAPCKGPFVDGPLPSAAAAKRAHEAYQRSWQVQGPERRELRERSVRLNPTIDSYWSALADELQTSLSGTPDFARAADALCHALDLKPSDAVAGMRWKELAAVLTRLGDPGAKQAAKNAWMLGEK